MNKIAFQLGYLYKKSFETDYDDKGGFISNHPYKLFQYSGVKYPVSDLYTGTGYDMMGRPEKDPSERQWLNYYSKALPKLQRYSKGRPFFIGEDKVDKTTKKAVLKILAKKLASGDYGGTVGVPQTTWKAFSPFDAGRETRMKEIF